MEIIKITGATIMTSVLLLGAVNFASAQNTKTAFCNNVIKVMKMKYKMLSDVPNSTILAIISTESSFDSNAVGLAGEIGLMQVKPTTAEWIYTVYGVSGSYRLDTDNILAGMMFLSWLKKRIGTPGYIQAYNIGLAGYKKGRRNYGYLRKVLTAKMSYLWSDL